MEGGRRGQSAAKVALGEKGPRWGLWLGQRNRGVSEKGAHGESLYPLPLCLKFQLVPANNVGPLDSLWKLPLPLQLGIEGPQAEDRG